MASKIQSGTRNEDEASSQVPVVAWGWGQGGVCLQDSRVPDNRAVAEVNAAWIVSLRVTDRACGKACVRGRH